MYKILPEKENPILRGIAKDIAVPDIRSARIRAFISDMKKLLSVEKYGVALAAPQVGEPLRLFIISGKALAIGKRTAPDAAKAEETPPPSDEESPRLSGQAPQKIQRGDPEGQQAAYGAGTSLNEESPQLPDQVYINPELLKLSRKKSKKHEGCLSIRGKWGIVPRAEKAAIRAYDENGVQFTRGASGFLAHVFQHELDHLEGILYTDKAAKMYEETEEHPPAA